MMAYATIIQVSGAEYNVKDPRATDIGLELAQDAAALYGGNVIGAGSEYTAESGSGLYVWKYKVLFPAGIYTIVYNISSSDANSPSIRFSRYTDQYSQIAGSTRFITIGETVSLSVEVTEPFGQIWLFAGENSTDSAGRSLTVNRLDVHRGIYVDSGNGLDVTQTIQYALEKNGICHLEKGVYTVDGLMMPAGSELSGCSGAIIDLPEFDDSRTVNLSTYSGTGSFNSWTLTSYGLTRGFYEITINMSSDFTDPRSTILFCSEESYSSANIIYSTTVERDKDVTFEFYSPKQIKSVFVFAGRNTQYSGTFSVSKLVVKATGHAAILFDGSGATIRGLTIRGSSTAIEFPDTFSVGSQIGVALINPSISGCAVNNCELVNFDYAAIYASGTGTDVDHGLCVSDCFISGNIIGIYIKINSEYHKVTNCIVCSNWYGVLCRGGNCLFSNCGFDYDVVGMRFDQAEGSNGGHGNVSNCTINHTNGGDQSHPSGNGIEISDTGRMLINGCNFYYSKIVFSTTNGNIMSGCGFGSNSGITSTGNNGASLIVGCMTRSTGDLPISEEYAGSLKVINCYTRGGDEIIFPASN